MTSPSTASTSRTARSPRCSASLPSSALPYHVRKEAILAGVVVDVRRRGNRVSIVLDDDTERIEVTMFEEVFAQAKHVIAKHAVLIAEGQLRYDDFINGWRLTAKRVRSADEAIEEYARRLTIRWPSAGPGPELVRELQRVLKPFTRGRCEVSIEYRRERRRGVADARRGMVRAAQARAARSADAAPRRRLATSSTTRSTSSERATRSGALGVVRDAAIRPCRLACARPCARAPRRSRVQRRICRVRALVTREGRVRWPLRGRRRSLWI